MQVLPIVLNRPKVLLIGGGKVATQKATALLKSGIDFTAVSINFIEEFPNDKNIKKFVRAVSRRDLVGYSLIIDATGNNEVRALVLSERWRLGYLLNRVDEPDESDIFFTSMIVRGDLKISVSTSGKSPKMGQIVRDHIDRVLPDNLNNLLNNFGIDRENNNLDLNKVENETRSALRKVFLIGAGTGDPDLLTVKALKTMQIVNVMFYDHLVSKEILELVPKSCRLVSVGKQAGSHSKKQREINKMMFDEVEKGNLVGRLKAGDPYVFGRGGEEFMFLSERGINIEVIAGVSSSISYGLPPTLRGVSSGFSIVSAHLSGNRINLDWVDLLKMKNHTVVVLMGLSRRQEIKKRAIELEIDLDYPVLIVSYISRLTEKRVLCKISELDEIENISSPAVLIFGEIAKYDQKFNMNSIIYSRENYINNLNNDMNNEENENEELS